MWLGVDLRTDTTEKKHVFNNMGAHNMLTILGSIATMIEAT